MKFFAKQITVDQHGKASNFRMHSLQRPHMRVLHVAWISFMVAFMAWFSIPPVMDNIAQDLHIPAAQVYDSNMAAVAITSLAQFLVIGPMCERIGPKRMMAALLVVGAIPCGMTGLLSDGIGLIVVRCAIGILGGSFVPCQFWTTQVFAPSVVGTANAMAAGWGDMGAGISYLLMPAIYSGIAQHLGSSVAWRVVFVFPAGLCLLMAAIDYFFTDDTPNGDWITLRRQEAQEKSAVSVMEAGSNEGAEADIHNTEKKYPSSMSSVGVSGNNNDGDDSSTIPDVGRTQSIGSAFLSLFCVLVKPRVLIVAAFYACSLGTQLAVNNVIGEVFHTNFGLDTSTAAYIGSVFGMLNIISRLSGGLFSDFWGRRFHLPGRILAHLILMVIEGIALIGFSFGLATNLGVAIAIMVIFSFFVQAMCGTTFGLVPFIDPANNGKVMGIVSAGGNVGGLVLNLMFGQFQPNFHAAFLCLGLITTGIAILGCGLLRVQGKMLWHLFSNEYAT